MKGLNAVKVCTQNDDRTGDIPLPRSLSRYAPGVRLRRAVPAQTKQAERLSTDSGDNRERNM